MKTRRSVGSLERTDNCFFCGEDEGKGPLHQAKTFNIDKRVRDYAETLQDHRLLAKLSIGDMHALDAKYHKRCLTAQ